MLTHGCTPFMKRIDMAFEKAIKLKQYRKLVGHEAQAK